MQCELYFFSFLTSSLRICNFLFNFLGFLVEFCQKSGTFLQKTRTQRMTFGHSEFLVTKNVFEHNEFEHSECRTQRGIAVLALLMLSQRRCPHQSCHYRSKDNKSKQSLRQACLLKKYLHVQICAKCYLTLVLNEVAQLASRPSIDLRLEWLFFISSSSDDLLLVRGLSTRFRVRLLHCITFSS